MNNKTVWVVHFDAQNTSVVEGVYSKKEDAEEAAGEYSEISEMELIK